MLNILFYIIIIFYLIQIKCEKIVEINFYRDLSNNIENDYSELIKNKLYTIFEIGSFQKKINFQLLFHTPYFSISSKDVQNSITFKPLEPNYTFYSKTEFNMAQKSEEKIKINDKIIINNFKFISDGYGDANLGLNLNFDNNKLLNFSFIKELKKNDLIDNYNIKILYNKSNFTHGKIIFGSSPKYTIPLHIEEKSIFCFRVDQITYKGEDYTTDIGLDFNSGGIVVPGNCFKEIEKFFEPYINDKICNYILLMTNYESTIFCNKEFNSFDKFGNIYFNINDFNFRNSFILEGKDLFMKINNGYLFLIRSYAFYTLDKWVLGLPFFSKYAITFNLDKKFIGFDIDKDINDNDNLNDNNKNTLPWILFGSLAILLIIIFGINIYIFVFKKKRKIRANELDEDILYDNNKKNDSEDNKLGI